MSNFKFYKSINNKDISINIIYDDYIDLGDNKYAPSRLRAVISGLDDNYIESRNRIGYKEFEIGRDELALILKIDSSKAEQILKNGENIFLKTEIKEISKTNNPAISHLIKMIDNFLEGYKK